MNCCAVDCCPHEPVVRIGYTIARTPHTYLLCQHHRAEAWGWVHSRFGAIPITEDAPDVETRQPALFGTDEANR